MARIRINRGVAYVTGLRFSRKAVEEFVDAAERRAKINAAQGEYATGLLALTVTGRTWVTGLRVHGSVGSALPYAKMADRGTHAHAIFPRGNYPLRFYWKKMGRVVRFPSVNHPGGKATGWLTKALIVEGERRGWRVIITP